MSTEGIRTMRKAWLLAAALFVASPAAANDSTASMGAGGLIYTTSSLIEIQRETLVIGEDEVHVSYDFLNTGTEDISTLVAFPLPDLDFDGDWNYAIETDDPINWIGFRVWVDGKEVVPQVEARATNLGVDVTDVLERYDIPITLLSGERIDALDARLNALPPEAKAELLRYGVVDWTSQWGAEGVPYPTMHWTSHIAFYWFQTFPAGKTLHVEHRYRPVPGYSFVTPEALDESYVKDAFCIDAAQRQDIASRIGATEMKVMEGAEIGYVLSTSENWLGPIGHFSLRIEKGKADNKIATCWQGLTPAGEHGLVFEAEYFQPDQDLRFLLIKPMEDAP
jgi:hypothetical protein